MLELPWYNAPQHTASAEASHANASQSEAKAAPAQKPADEQFRNAVRGAVKTLVTTHGVPLKNAVMLPCGHVCDQFEATSLYKQKLAREKVAQKSTVDAERVAQLKASASKTYVCMRCPAERRTDIGVKPTDLKPEPRISKFLSTCLRDIPGNIDEATAEALDLLKSDLRKEGVGFPQLPKTQPAAGKEHAAYNGAVGESLAREGKLVEAEVWFRAAVYAEPEHDIYNHNMGVCLTKQGRIADAAPFVTKANALRGKASQNATHTGPSLLAAGHFAEAEALFRAALKSEPLNARLHSLMATCLSGQGKHAEALEHFKSAASMQPSNVEYRRGVGYSLYMLGSYAEAEEHLQKALWADPKSARLNYELAWCKRKLGNKEAAEHLFLQTLSSDGEKNPHYLNDIGMFFFLQKRYVDAWPHLQKAVMRDGKNATFRENLDACARKIEKKSTPLLGRVKKFF